MRDEKHNESPETSDGNEDEARRISAQILSIFDLATSRGTGEDGKEIAVYATISDAEADRIQKNTGFDLHDWFHCITEDGIRHTLDEHGDPVKERKRGQIAVTRADFANIHYVIKNADKITHDGKTRQGLDAIKYEKRINGYMVVVEEKRGKEKKRLAFTSMRILRRPPKK